MPVRIAPYWSPLLTLVLFPPAGLLVLAALLAEGPLVRALAGLLGVCAFWALDYELRGALNDNVARAESARRALAAAPGGGGPIALILRSFGRQQGYHDRAASFSLFELVEPALRQTGFRPCTLGADLPLPPRHGVCLLESTAADWRQTFDTLAAGAAVILIAPESSPSVLEEAAALRARGFLHKTVVLMAPASIEIDAGGADLPTVVSGGDDDARRGRWEAVRKAFRQAAQAELPAYRPEGGLLEIDAESGAARGGPLRRGHGERRAGAILARWHRGVYREDYAVPFGEVWQEVCRRKGFSGPPIREVWPSIDARGPELGLSSYWRPPGDDGRFRRNASRAAAFGWAGPAIVLVLWALAPLLV